MATIDDMKNRSPEWARELARKSTRGYGMATARMRAKPDYLIIGAKRGGTTSLFKYLRMHPGVLGMFPQPRASKSTDYFFGGAPRGSRWYTSHFHTHRFLDKVAGELGYRPITGEASPYYIWDERIAQLAKNHNPNVKAIMLVRDPVERAFSHWQERVQNGVEPLSFEDALAAEESRTAGELEKMTADPTYHSTAHDWYTYRARGLYLPQIQNWLSVFPQEQLLILRSEDMYGDVQTMADVAFEFLGLPKFELPTTKTFNASRRPDMPVGPAQELAEFYAPHNAELEAFLGRDLGWTQP
ncbi:MAG TPA: sulfotransferase domain-containing protein [Nocardioidaceae bacterium]|nr:sulfotransferase domain-containing protein [Nocardioidaceae bacterium]